MNDFFCIKFRNVIKVFILVLPIVASAQLPETTKEDTTKSPYIFTIEKKLPNTLIKNQAKTGTCWCFATLSFLESELLRTGKEDTG